jgi:periplasmic divalent cation tolerance protein
MSTPSPDRYCVALITAGSADEAARIGRALVEERLAACANIVGPIRSIYRWREELQDEPEHLLLVKTRRNLFNRLAERVGELHSYETPGIIALPVIAGSAPYLEWVGASTV